MSKARSFGVMKSAALIASLTMLVSGCTYDYLSRSDRVAYHAGDAVKANLQQETIDPSKKSMNSTSGLGKTGVRIP